MPGGQAGPLGTAGVMASSLAPCRLTAGKVSWAAEAPSAPCLYCDMLSGAHTCNGPVAIQSLCRESIPCDSVHCALRNRHKAAHSCQNLHWLRPPLKIQNAQVFVTIVGLKNICSSQCVLS